MDLNGIELKAQGLDLSQDGPFGTINGFRRLGHLMPAWPQDGAASRTAGALGRGESDEAL